MSTYRATFGSMPGLALVLVLMSGLFITVGVEKGAPYLLAAGVGLLVLLILLRARLRVVLTAESVRYTGIFGTRVIRFADLIEVRRAAEKGFLASRWYGPFTYELRTPSQSIRLNLKLFPLELSTELLRKLDAA